MLHKTETGYKCKACGREFDADDDLYSGGPCPSDDCPSNEEEQDFSQVVDRYIDQNNLTRTEGPAGVRNLEKLVAALGYSADFSASAIHAFLEDNSGCIEAMIEWIRDRNVSEWKESLESQLSEEED